jgi:hypothetical protein
VAKFRTFDVEFGNLVVTKMVEHLNTFLTGIYLHLFY